MINENEKVYYICEKCSKQDTCTYSKMVVNTIKEYTNTPLNIHFPMCKEYVSFLYEKMWSIENNEPIAKFKDIPKDGIESVARMTMENFKSILEA